MKTQGYVLEHTVLDKRTLSLILPQEEELGFLLGASAQRNFAMLSRGVLTQLSSLSECLSKLTADREEILRLGADLCRALLFLERHDAVHGSISPECIYCADSGYVLAGSPGSDTDPLFPGRSFSAPEKEAGGPLSPALDIYSVGAILYALTELGNPGSGYSRLKEIAQHACAAAPESRYFSPVPLMQDLLSLSSACHSAEPLSGPEPGSPPCKEKDRPSLLIKSTGERLSLSRGFLSIGRGRDCDLVFDKKPSHRHISRHHAILFRQNGSWFVEDTDSKNGTKLNGITLFSHAVYPLRENDVISLATAEELVFCAA